MPGSFLTQFIDENFIETLAALIGFNIASVIFLLGQLFIYEQASSKELFPNTRKGR